MSTLAEVMERARSLVEDEDGDFATDSYLIPKINQCYSQAVSFLLSEGTNPFAEKVMDYPNVAAGTTDFIAATAPGKPWDGLENPLVLEVKQVGQPVEAYKEVPLVARLPNLSPIANLQPGIVYGERIGAAEWRGNQIYITPFVFAVDARLRADFRPSKLVKPDDRVLVHADMTMHLSYSTAALIGAARGNPGWIQAYGPEAESSLDVIANFLQKQVQGQINKFARPRRRRFFR